MPTLRRLIFDGLQTLSPNKLRWYLTEFVHDRQWSDNMIDTDTRQIVLMVMADVTNTERLRLTREELMLCYTRFNQLRMLGDAVEQGLMKEIVSETGPVQYQMLTAEIQSVLEPIRVRAKAPHFDSLIYYCKPGHTEE